MMDSNTLTNAVSHPCEILFKTPLRDTILERRFVPKRCAKDFGRIFIAFGMPHFY